MSTAMLPETTTTSGTSTDAKMGFETSIQHTSSVIASFDAAVFVIITVIRGPSQMKMVDLSDTVD